VKNNKPNAQRLFRIETNERFLYGKENVNCQDKQDEQFGIYSFSSQPNQKQTNQKQTNEQQTDKQP